MPMALRSDKPCFVSKNDMKRNHLPNHLPLIVEMHVNQTRKVPLVMRIPVKRHPPPTPDATLGPEDPPRP